MTNEEKKQKRKEYNKKYRDKTKEYQKEYQKDYRDKTKEYQKEYQKDYRDKTKEYQKEYQKQYRCKIKETKKKYKENNKEYIQQKYKERKERNKKYNTEYVKRRRQNDPYFKIICNIRRRTHHAINDYNLSKNNSTMKMLGCDKNTLMYHLQKTGELYDPNFNIYDYDGSQYHIDHIKTFADVEKGLYTLEEVTHYTNLQILPAEINLSKGGNSW